MQYFRKFVSFGLLLLLGFGIFQLSTLLQGVPRASLNAIGVVVPETWEGARLGKAKECRAKEPVTNAVYDEGRKCYWFESETRAEHPIKFYLSLFAICVGIIGQIWWHFEFDKSGQRRLANHTDPDVQALLREEISLQEYASRSKIR
jgi:hypothetical protein